MPNIVYLMPDEWRFDALGARGNPAIRTPNLDKLAARGTLFEAAHCESPVCQPSRASVLTGRYVSDHRLRDNELSPRACGAVFPGAENDTFLRRLQELGYYTAAVGKLNFTFPEYELARRLRAAQINELSAEGFAALIGQGDLRDTADEVRAYGLNEVHEEADKQSLLLFNSGYTDYLERAGLLDEWRKRVLTDSGPYLHALLVGADAPMYATDGPPAVPENLASADTLDSFIGTTACEFVRDYEGDQPFFLWVNFVGPHPPFDAPERHPADRAERPVRRGPAGPPHLPPNAWGDYVRWTRQRTGCSAYTDADWDQIVRQYYAGCELIDDQIGRIVAGLEEAGVLDETWILFGSDHGELLGDHGLIQKRVFYDGSVLVPSLITPPTGGAGSNVTCLVQNFDLAASAVDIAGGGPVFGDARSLLPLLSGVVAARAVVFSEIADFVMVRDHRYKLIVQRWSGEPQALYDLAVDPEEMVDVLGQAESASIVRRMTADYVAGYLSRFADEQSTSTIVGER